MFQKFKRFGLLDDEREKLHCFANKKFNINLMYNMKNWQCQFWPG